jgi:hypothetical protein
MGSWCPAGLGCWSQSVIEQHLIFLLVFPNGIWWSFSGMSFGHCLRHLCWRILRKWIAVVGSHRNLIIRWNYYVVIYTFSKFTYRNSWNSCVVILLVKWYSVKLTCWIKCLIITKWRLSIESRLNHYGITDRSKVSPAVTRALFG